MNAANNSMCYIMDEQLLYIYLYKRNHATDKIMLKVDYKSLNQKRIFLFNFCELAEWCNLVGILLLTRRI